MFGTVGDLRVRVNCEDLRCLGYGIDCGLGRQVAKGDVGVLGELILESSLLNYCYLLLFEQIWCRNYS